MKSFCGKALFLDRSDINTDEIIPAKYLTEITKEALQPFALEDLKIDGFEPKRDIPGKSVIISRSNFGCGSSREHAPWALEVNGINAVIAESFARIFRQNMFNCGMMAIEVPASSIENLFAAFAGKDADFCLDVEHCWFELSSGGVTERIDFTISDFDKALVKAGGWVGYAEKKY
jgi:3-isopropylmalate/(R)-2-methylmalate dehydratase small subunit